jgi:hypothetical protein
MHPNFKKNLMVKRIKITHYDLPKCKPQQVRLTVDLTAFTTH